MSSQEHTPEVALCQSERLLCISLDLVQLSLMKSDEFGSSVT